MQMQRDRVSEPEPGYEFIATANAGKGEIVGVNQGVCSVIVGLFLSLGACAAPALSVFHIGNSLTDETYGVHSVAEGFGYSDVKWGRHMIPGAPLHWLWSHQADGFRSIYQGDNFWGTSYNNSPAALRENAWDVVVLQIFTENGDGVVDHTLDAAYGFAENAYQGNPDCRIYIYPGHTMNTGTRDNPGRMTTIFEPIAQRISDRYPQRKKVYVLPTINAFAAMWDTGERDLWGDGHANDKGKYLIYMVFYAVLYNADPTGAVHANLKWANQFGSVTAEYAAKAQDVAFATVKAYPPSGYVGSVAVRPGSNLNSAVLPNQTVAHKRYVSLDGRVVSPFVLRDRYAGVFVADNVLSILPQGLSGR